MNLFIYRFIYFRSMCSLVSDPSQSAAITHSPKRKFSFRFPQLPGIHSQASSDKVLNGSAGHLNLQSVNGNSTSGSTSNHHSNSNANSSLSPHSKKKNFTEELQNIPDIQVSQ